MQTRTVHDPFHGKDVQISDKLTDRLRGKYACGPILANGEPEFGWQQMPRIPIQIEAAEIIEAVTKLRDEIASQISGDPDGYYILGEPADDEQTYALRCVRQRLDSILAR